MSEHINNNSVSSSEDTLFDYVAHSDDPENGINFTQSYYSHASEVRDRALRCFDEMVKYMSLDSSVISAAREVLEIAAEYHDLGKLDLVSQEIIKKRHHNENGSKISMLNHVDAGSAFLLQKYSEIKKSGLSLALRINYLIAAVLIDAHHIGILNKILNENREERDAKLYPSLGSIVANIDILRSDVKMLKKYPYYKHVVDDKNKTVKEYVDETLSELLERHYKCFENSKKSIESLYIPILDHSMLLRFMLSCLVEGDHGDTSRHYGGIAPNVITFPLRADERLTHHMMMYDNFPLAETEKEREKNRVRSLIHKDCEEVSLGHNFYGIYAFPGYGKNHSGDYLALRLCREHGLRGVVKMAPYNDILTQNIRESKDFLMLPGEKSGEVIGEHYQDARHWERSQKEGINYKLLKHYSTLWNCPFEVVSVVQFFETMASNYPSKIRKLHQLTGRVIIIDEFHIAVPIKMLRQTLRWLKYLVDNCGCKVILMSGSSVKFWEIEQLKSCEIEVKEVLSCESNHVMNELEVGRVSYSRIEEQFNSFQQLAEVVMSRPGPRVVVFNTVLSAAIFANYIRLQYGREKVEHISTALTPKNRKTKYKVIKNRLKDRTDDDWVLVSTSCIETGVNFSFRTGFRENNCHLSLLQLGGRVNRGNEYIECCDVFVFNMDHEAMGTTNNPAFNASIKVHNDLFDVDRIGYGYCTESIRREIVERNKDLEYFTEIEFEEEQLCFGSVADLYKIIPRSYKSIVVDPEVIAKIDNEDIVRYRELTENSIQMFFTKLDRADYQDNIDFVNEDRIPNDKYKEAKIKAPKEFNVWTGEYDPDFLGYMKEILIRMGHSVE